MAFFFPGFHKSKPPHFEAGPFPLGGGIGTSFVAAMAVESIYFFHNDVFGPHDLPLLLSSLLLSAILGLWLQRRARMGFGFFTVAFALWIQLVLQCAVLLAFMPLDPGEVVGPKEWALGALLSAGFAALLAGPYAMLVLGTFGIAAAFATNAGKIPFEARTRHLETRAFRRALWGTIGLSLFASLPGDASGVTGLFSNPATLLCGSATLVLLGILAVDLSELVRGADDALRKELRAALAGDGAVLALSGASLAIHLYSALG
jgi:hypothetical protein